MVIMSLSCAIAALTFPTVNPSIGHSISASQMVFIIAVLDDVSGNSMSNWSANSAASACNCARFNGSKHSAHSSGGMPVNTQPKPP